MSTIRFFDLGDERYRLTHNNADDSRSVVTAEDMQGLLRFDASLNITNIKGERVGRLKTVGHFWALVVGDVEHELAPHNDHHWRDLENAEIQAAKLLIPTLASPIPSQERPEMYMNQTPSSAEGDAATLAQALRDLTPPMPPADAPCHVGIVPQDKCAHCRRIAAAHAALAGYDIHPQPQEAEPIAYTVAGEVTNWARDFSKYRTQHYTRPVYVQANVPTPELSSVLAENERLHRQNAFLLEQKQKAEAEAKTWFDQVQGIRSQPRLYELQLQPHVQPNLLTGLRLSALIRELQRRGHHTLFTQMEEIVDMPVGATITVAGSTKTITRKR